MPTIFARFHPDICFIVAGCDTLAGDPLANLEMSHEGIVKRDEMIVAACVQRNIPVVFTLSGGYSRDAWLAQYKSIKNLATDASRHRKSQFSVPLRGLPNDMQIAATIRSTRYSEHCVAPLFLVWFVTLDRR
ncbi:MAG: hypothetical protein Q8M16_06285 [Pirellulaceae bacterium]|nr:hypothetical protein [Pirellulaceae bacterium]